MQLPSWLCVAGSAFLGFVLLHLVQRRHTVARLAVAVGQPFPWFKRRGRMAWSDLALALLTLNALISGVYDLAAGNHVSVQPRSVGIRFELSGGKSPQLFFCLRTCACTWHVVGVASGAPRFVKPPETGTCFA